MLKYKFVFDKSYILYLWYQLLPHNEENNVKE